MPFSNASPPSSAISANFWEYHELYVIDYDRREMDCLLALLGQSSSSSQGACDRMLPGAPASLSGATGWTQQQHLLPSSQLQMNQALETRAVRVQFRHHQIVLPRDKLRSLAKSLPKRCYAFLEGMIDDGNNAERYVTLPIAYLVNLSMWTSPTVIQDLVAQSRGIYIRGSIPYKCIDGSDKSIWSILLANPKKAVKRSLTLEQIINSTSISFHSRIYALMELAYHRLYVEGAGPFYSDLAVIGKFVRHHLQRANQVIDLARLGNKKDFGIAVYMYCDVMASIALGRPTTCPMTCSPYVNDAEHRRYVFGFEHLLCIAADIATFKSFLNSSPKRRLPDGSIAAVYKAQADSLHNRIRTSRCCLPFDADGNSVHYLSLLAGHELWRQAILIHFYQSIYNLNNKDTRLNQCMKQIIELWRFMKDKGGGPAKAETAETPSIALFLASTVAEEKEHQDILRGFYEEMARTCAADLQAVEFLELFWSEQDKLQRPMNWLDYTSKDKGPAFV